MDKATQEHIMVIAKAIPNDQEMGRYYRSMANALTRFNKAIEFVEENKGELRVDYHAPDYVRFEYWEQAPAEISDHLLKNGFRLEILDDEDCGQKFYYTL